MKSFLKMLLATILGGGILIFLSFVVFFSFITAASTSLTEKEVIISENSVLKLNLNSVVFERTEENPFEELSSLAGTSPGGIGLNILLRSIKEAKDDPLIKGIYLQAGIPLAGHASLTQIRTALEDFKKSGKFIYSYSEILTQKGLYLSSVADSVLVNPEGFMEWKGLSANVTYYKEALNKLGVKPEVLRATGNRYKSAVEPYLRQDMSPENRQQLEVLLSSIWKEYLVTVGNAQNLNTDSLQSLADNYAITNPKTALDKGLIDGVMYYDQVMDLLSKECDVKDSDKLKFVSLQKYADAYKAESGYGKDKIAVIIAQGDIVSGNGDEYSIGSERISKAIRKARKDDKVKAVVLRVNSPGGSALASEIIWREVQLTKGIKPVVASMGDLAASGGYYISCFADTIVAQQNTITGSIGAFGLFMTGEELLHNKLGINIETVPTNKYSDLGTFDRPLTDSERAILIASVDQIYGTFKQRVAEGRGLDVDYVDSIGQGRVWSGEDAKKLGLVDVLGGINEAIKIAENMAGLSNGDYKLVEYPKVEDPITRLMKSLSGDYETKVLEDKLGEYARYLKLLETAKGMQGYQTRLEYDLVID